MGPVLCPGFRESRAVFASDREDGLLPLLCTRSTFCGDEGLVNNGEKEEEDANKPGNPQLMGSSHSLAVALQIKATAYTPVSPQILMDYARQHGQH